MDLSDTKEEAAFRTEVRSFIEANRPSIPHQGGEWGSANVGGDRMWRTRAWTEWMAALASRGWVCPTWPEEFGGGGLSLVHQFILHEEMAWASTPRPDPIGQVIGAMILRFGSPDQKERLLPGIARGEVIWCQGYSEPDSGSDLASVRTRAVRTDEGYVINGQKIWTSWAHMADYIHLIVRTHPDAPKHEGLSYFWLPMDTPGMTVSPIVNLLGQHEFNEVFFEDVQARPEHLLGEEGRGWSYAVAALDVERSMVGNAVDQINIINELLEMGRKLEAPRERMVGLTDCLIRARIARLLSYRVMSLQKAGAVPTHEASVVKVFLTELDQEIARQGALLLGPYGVCVAEDDALPLEGRAARMLLHTRASTLGGGTSEIQRNIIGTRGLGLPT